MVKQIGASKHAMIIGTGLVGSLWSIYLSRRGFKVSLFERRPDLRHLMADSGRSINLALSFRGLKALEHVGLKSDIEALGIPMHGRLIHALDGSTSLHPYSHQGDSILSVSRGRLNALLLDLAEQDASAHGDKPVHFEHRCNRIDLDTARAQFTDDYRNIDYTVSADVIFGADGANSIVRRALMKNRRYNYSQSFLKHGYKELTIPAVQGDYALEPHTLHIWPRGQYMLIALPNLDKSFTATLFLAHESEDDAMSFAKLGTKKAVLQFFDETFPDVLKVMPDLAQEFFANPVSDLGTVRCEPWHYQNKACLLGDAAHAIVPFYGQGLNAGFEDCFVLDQLLEESGNLETAFERYSKQRKKDADAIADLALHNFIEMRDHVTNALYLRCRAIEKKICAHFPKRYMTQYHMVTFSDCPYHEAQIFGEAQKKFIKELAMRPEIEVDLHSEESTEIILEKTEAFLSCRKM